MLCDSRLGYQAEVCKMMLLGKSLTGEEVATQLITSLSTELSIPQHLVVKGRASVNDVARRTISVLYNNMMDVGCFSHTLDHVGENMNTPILEEFIIQVQNRERNMCLICNMHFIASCAY